MRTRLAILGLLAGCLLSSGCEDSLNPLSDPLKSKSDMSLVGVWRFESSSGDVTYYHVGLAPDRLPDSMMHVVSVLHHPGNELGTPSEGLIFPTTLGGNTYLNYVEMSRPQWELFEKKGWDHKTVGAYSIFKYKIEGNTVLVWSIDDEAKRLAIEAEKVKGEVEKTATGTRARFTDTSENLARFITEAGDSLFSKEVTRLERVK